MPAHNAVVNMELDMAQGTQLDISGTYIEATELDVNKIVPSTGTSVEIEAALITLDGAVVAPTSVVAKNAQITATDNVTATTGGATTGLIPSRTSFVAVTSDSANKQITLPAGVVGDVIRILVGATGCELICATAADKINDVTCGATNEAALVATTMYTCMCVATNTWVMHGLTNLGSDEAAVVPDAL